MQRQVIVKEAGDSQSRKPPNHVQAERIRAHTYAGVAGSAFPSLCVSFTSSVTGLTTYVSGSLPPPPPPLAAVISSYLAISLSS